MSHSEICTRPTMGSDPIFEVCPSCGHNPLAHPGYANRGDTELEGCLVCILKAHVGEVKGHQFTNDPIKRSDK